MPQVWDMPATYVYAVLVHMYNTTIHVYKQYTATSTILQYSVSLSPVEIPAPVITMTLHSVHKT